MFFFACNNNSEMIFIPQPQEQESGRRQAQCSSILCECLCTGPIWGCPLQPFQMRYFVFVFFSNQNFYCFCVCNNSKQDFMPQPQEQLTCRRHTQYSSTLCGCLCTLPIWCCPVQPFYMRYFVVHFWLKHFMVQNTYIILLFKHTTR